ncbi:MAG TPA: hypothetical protein VKD21_13375 [Acidimicrobiales bacterium]|nr:hypothetical protein [Acidimicrobiales bacterium]
MSERQPERVPRRRLWVGIAGAVAIVALLAASVAAAWTSVDEADDDPLSAPGGGGGTGGEGSAGDGSDGERSGGEPGPPASEAEVRAAVDDISAVVERERGLAFTQPVDVELAGEGEFQRRLLDDFDEGVDELRETEVLLKAFGLVEPDVDLVEAMRRLLGAGVVGFYDPETDELVVRGTQLTPYVRTTIAHELTHAIDDQHFDLDRPEYDDADDEIGFGFTALVEGNARRVEDAYRAGLSEEEQLDAAAEELSLGGDMDLGDVPLVLIDLITAPYGLGQDFVVDLIDDEGQGALDAAFGAPPRTSEQVIDPAAYEAGEAAIAVPPPDVAGQVVDTGTAGQLLIQLVLANELGADRARKAAAGWGGDAVVAWRDGQRPCATLAAVGDDAGETAELGSAFGDWAGEHGRGGAATRPEVTIAPGGDGPVTVQSCAP